MFGQMAGQLLNRKREGEVEQNKQTPHKKEGKSKKKVDLLAVTVPTSYRFLSLPKPTYLR